MSSALRKVLTNSVPRRSLSSGPSVHSPYFEPIVHVEATDFNKTLEEQAIRITKEALQNCGIENEIASYMKKEFDEIAGPTWHCIVGRNFGSHIQYERFIHLSIAKIFIILFKCG